MTARGILIVEDDAIVALALKVQLVDLGYRVLAVVATAADAISMGSHPEVGLVLMDIRLDGAGDGIEAAAAIRRERDVPVVFLTSHSDPETVRRAAETGAYGYLTKPYQIKELRAAIEVALTKAMLERQLREADRWFAHTLRCVQDGVIVTERDASVRFLNPAAERLTGWSHDEAVGRPVAVIATLAAEADLRALRAGIEGEHPTAFARGAPLRSRAGTVTPVDGSVGPVQEDNGQRLGAVLVLRDASERLVHEAERARLEAAEATARMKGEFLSRVSHEMRTPLNAVLGFAQLLEGETSAERTSRYARHILQAGEHLLAMVNDVLDLQRVANGGLRLNLQPLALQAALAEAAQLLGPQAEAQHVCVEHPDGACGQVLADPVRLRQVLLNLVSNAIKYNRPGGRVRLLPVPAERTDRVAFAIEDDGIGMTEQQTERLFQPFDRLGQENTRIPGIGLGLVIARGLVESMGGTLELHSAPRSGTRVTVLLPAAQIVPEAT